MSDVLTQLFLFSAKTFILFIFLLAILIAFFALLAKSKQKIKGRLSIKHLNQKYEDNQSAILTEVLSKKEFKQFNNDKKAAEKANKKVNQKQRNIYVIDFIGDIKASAVCALREEITTILTVAKKEDEVVLRLESPGGIVPGYGLAAAQLMRLRDANIPLTICIDKVAASGGYMMACIGNKILSGPFAVIGSIGVIVQLPNFHRFLQDKHIDFEQHTAGEYKRTITVFGENTESGREKLRHEIEEIHHLFKNLISQFRSHIDIQQVATGEHWYGQQALNLKLVDEIKTSDDYLLTQSKSAQIYELSYEIKKSFLSKLATNANLAYERLFSIRLN